MDGFVIRVTTYHGNPRSLGSVFCRASVSHDTVFTADDAVNHPADESVVDKLNGVSNRDDYLIDSLIGDFQDEYKCKVSYETPGSREDGHEIIKFDVFEPSCEDATEAWYTASELTQRLVDWVQGYPMGR